MSLPSNDFTVATTSWMPDLSSSSFDFASMSLRLAALHHAGLIDHPPGQRREVERQYDGRHQTEDEERNGQSRGIPLHHQLPDAPPPPDEPPPPEKSLSDELPLEESLLLQLEELDEWPAGTKTRRPRRTT